MKNLLIVFIKNPIPGKVKTRLAEKIGADAALEVYHKLINITKSAVEDTDADVRIYYSSEFEENIWTGVPIYIQNGIDLGERMKNAMDSGFQDGYERICLIGSDLPTITSEIIQSGFNSLNFMDVVLGPAEDGGYYLIGLKKMIPEIFMDKPWSHGDLLEKTLEDLTRQKESYFLLKTLNDIDTYEDLIRSGITWN